MIDNKCRDHDLEDVSRKVMMKKKRSIVEEEGDEVEEVTDKQDLTNVNEFGEKLWNEKCMNSILIQETEI